MRALAPVKSGPAVLGCGSKSLCDPASLLNQAGEPHALVADTDAEEGAEREDEERKAEDDLAACTGAHLRSALRVARIENRRNMLRCLCVLIGRPRWI
jgi:hypothetical protein